MGVKGRGRDRNLEKIRIAQTKGGSRNNQKELVSAARLALLISAAWMMVRERAVRLCVCVCVKGLSRKREGGDGRDDFVGLIYQ